MKVFYRIVIIVFLFCFCFKIEGQSVFDDYESEMISKNHIKTKTHLVLGTASGSNYKSLHVLYNEQGQVVEETSFRSSGEIAVKRNYKYNNKGQVIEYQSYDGRRKKITYKKFVKYDQNSNKISEIGFDGVDRFDNKYIYDAQNRLQEIRYYISDNLIEKRVMKYTDNQEIYIYKANNSLAEKQVKYYIGKKLIKESTFSPTGDEKKRIEYNYDASGNMTHEAIFFLGTLKQRKTFVYEGGKLTKVYLEEADADVPTKINKFLDRVYEYNDKGHLTIEKWIDKSSQKYSTKKYQYDSRDNVISIESFFVAYNFGEDLKITYTFY